MSDTITSTLRGRTITVEEARISVQRLINSHFHNPDAARCSIPRRADDDDIVASDFVERYAAEHEARLAAEQERDALKQQLAVCERAHIANNAKAEAARQIEAEKPAK